MWDTVLHRIQTDRKLLVHIYGTLLLYLWQTQASSMAENRDPHWKKLQQTEEHIERAESAHSKF